MELKTILEKAISFEEELSKSLTNLNKNQEFFDSLGDKKEKIKDLLDALIEESNEHKLTLVNIENNI